MSRDGACPGEDEIAAFVEGRLAGPALAAFEEHLAGCATCRQVVAITASAPATPSPTSLELSRGVSYDRYVILDLIGAGAMGSVYRAYDPDLDRRIALKLVRAPSPSAEGRERLLREAKAMARVKHHNVVGVFDAGLHGDHVYIAMELVEGTSLRHWLAESHTPDQIVERFVAAGRGLAAAHAVGLVHRDFKPDNVLVAQDGHVCVTDFGLAKTGAESTPADAPLDATAIAGTPAYMAPEQLRGEPIDARSDQFAFCVALCEGLTGQRPFVGRTVEELGAAMQRGPQLPSGLPLRVRRALARGLSPDPARRFPSMDDLLAELSAWSRRRTRFAAVALVAAVVTSVAVFGATQVRSACGAVATREVAALWAPRSEAIHAAFDATKSPLATSAFAGVERAVTAHLEDFRVARTATCEANAQPDDPRVACLAERHRELEALFDVLAGADAAVVREAVLAAHRIPPIDACADLASAAGALAPTSPEAVAVAEQIALAQAQKDAGRYEPALESAREALAEAAPLPDPRFALRARLLEAELDMVMGRSDPADQLYFDAVAAGDDETAARAVLVLVQLYAEYRREPDEALAWSRHADAAIRRVGDVPLLRAKWHFLQGIVASRQGRYTDAIDQFGRAVALDTEALGPDHLVVATDLAGLGTALTGAGRFDEALVHQQRALALAETALGPDHPVVANRLINLAITYGRAGRAAESLPTLQRALPLARTGFGPEHPTTLLTIGVLGAVYIDLEEDARAAEVLQEGAAVVVEKDLWNPSAEHLFLNLALARSSIGHHDDALETLALVRRCYVTTAPPPQIESQILAIRGEIELGRGQLEAALATFRAQRRIVDAMEPDPTQTGPVALDIGRTLRLLGRADEAARELDQAAADLERGFGPDHFLLAGTLVELGELELERGGRAEPYFEQALAIAEGSGRIEETAQACFGLARAVAPTDPSRARSLGERARDTFAKRDVFAADRARVEAWLATLDGTG